MVWEADPQTLKFTFVSKQVEQLLGYPPADWLARADVWQNHVHPEDRERVLALSFKASREQQTQHFEHRMQSADGHWLWLRNMVSVSLKNRSLAPKLQGVIWDITQRKQAEEALRLSEEQFRQSQRMEAIGRMAGGI